MLINKTDKDASIKYNQHTIVVKPKKSLDVRDFGISNENIEKVEKHIVNKNPGVFDQIKTKDILETNKEHIVKIETLEKELSDVKEKISVAEKACKAAEDKVKSILNENDGFKKENKALLSQISTLKAKVKAAE